MASFYRQPNHHIHKELCPQAPTARRSLKCANRSDIGGWGHHIHKNHFSHLPIIKLMGNRLSKIATRTGDEGMTGLGDGSRVEKDHLRICAMGDVDELNSVIGVLMA